MAAVSEEKTIIYSALVSYLLKFNIYNNYVISPCQRFAIEINTSLKHHAFGRHITMLYANTKNEIYVIKMEQDYANSLKKFDKKISKNSPWYSNNRNFNMKIYVQNEENELKTTQLFFTVETNNEQEEPYYMRYCYKRIYDKKDHKIYPIIDNKKIFKTYFINHGIDVNNVYFNDENTCAITKYLLPSDEMAITVYIIDDDNNISKYESYCYLKHPISHEMIMTFFHNKINMDKLLVSNYHIDKDVEKLTIHVRNSYQHVYIFYCSKTGLPLIH